MNGIMQEKLIESLRKIQTRLCAYTNQPCDCKFMETEEKSHSYIRGESGSGCPELYQVLAIFSAMTPDEYDVIRQRAQISIFELDKNEISNSINGKETYDF